MTETDIDLDAVRSGEVKDLEGADLSDADLRRADLWNADLQGADLREVNLREANLRWAGLSDAHLQHADLRWADLRGADLWNATLWDATLPVYERLPETGDFTAYKGCRGHVVKVRVPAGVERVSALTGPKCRAEVVEVVEVLDAEGNECDATEASSWYDDGETVYREGKRVEPDDWDDDIRVECTHGIHIYPTKREAVEAVQDD